MNVDKLRTSHRRLGQTLATIGSERVRESVVDSER